MCVRVLNAPLVPMILFTSTISSLLNNEIKENIDAILMTSLLLSVIIKGRIHCEIFFRVFHEILL